MTVAEDEELLTTAELARLHGVSPEALRRWREEGCPCRGSTRAPRWSAEDVRAWLLARAQAAQRAESDGEPIRRAEFQRKRALAERYELELDVLRERYMLRSEARELFARVSGTLRRCFGALPLKLSGLSVVEIERELADVLEQVARELEGVEV